MIPEVFARKQLAVTASPASGSFRPVFMWVERAGTGCRTSTYSTTLQMRVVLRGYFGVPAAAPLQLR